MTQWLQSSAYTRTMDVHQIPTSGQETQDPQLCDGTETTKVGRAVCWVLRKSHLVHSLAVSSREDVTFCKLLADRKGERFPSESPSEAAATFAVASTSQRVSGCAGCEWRFKTRSVFCFSYSLNMALLRLPRSGRGVCLSRGSATALDSVRNRLSPGALASDRKRPRSLNPLVLEWLLFAPSWERTDALPDGRLRLLRKAGWHLLNPIGCRPRSRQTPGYLPTLRRSVLLPVM